MSAVSIVTGASSGIGLATARLLARRGDRVLATGRDTVRLAALAAETGAATIAADLAEPTSPAAIMAAARALGPVAVVVHSAGVPGYVNRSIFEQTEEGWFENMGVNLDAVFRLTQLAARDMRDNGYGRIVIVSSTAGETGGRNMVAYCAAKHGVLGLMRAVAQDVAAMNITCNAVCPGWVKTPMADAHAAQDARELGTTKEAVWQSWAESYAAKRVLTPEEIAETIAFLASSAASGINGEAVTVSLGAPW